MMKISINANNNTTITMQDGTVLSEWAIQRLLDDSEKLRKLDADLHYDYEESVKADVREYITDRFDKDEIIEKLAWDGRADWSDELYDELFTDDSVTGNRSGSYTFSSYQAMLYVANNMDLLEEAILEFGELRNGFNAEDADVTIRCYVLGGCISEVLSDLEDEYADEIERFEDGDDDEEDEEGEE